MAPRCQRKNDAVVFPERMVRLPCDTRYRIPVVGLGGGASVREVNGVLPFFPNLLTAAACGSWIWRAESHHFRFPDTKQSMADWPKRLSREAAREVASQIVWSYWPYWGAPAVSAILFYIRGYSAEIIFMAALGAFAVVAVGLNNFSQWIATQSASGKVDFVAPTVGVKMDDSSPPALEGLKLGVALLSTAPFPMEIRVDDLETQIVDRVPGDAFYARSITITRGHAAQFNNSLISLGDMDRAGKVLYGHINASVSYGRPGKLRHTITRHWYMALKFDKEGNFENAEPSLTALTKQNGA
jgi:hypothetical protein